MIKQQKGLICCQKLYHIKDLKLLIIHYLHKKTALSEDKTALG